MATAGRRHCWSSPGELDVLALALVPELPLALFKAASLEVGRAVSTLGPVGAGIGPELIVALGPVGVPLAEVAGAECGSLDFGLRLDVGGCLGGPVAGGGGA